MDEVFNRLTAWLAPILCFTAEEAWQSRHADINQSVHLRSYDLVPADWHNDAVAAKWAQIRKARQVVMSALETARNDGKIGASLQATPMVYISAEMQAAFAGQDAASLFITSSATLSSDAAPDGAFRLDAIDDVAVVVAVADGEKCARCWKITPEVTADVDICGRCQDVVSAQS
jgi:isoleucyl-tRNA synthetase